MKKVLLLITMIATIFMSCEKNEVSTEPVTFKLKVSDFTSDAIPMKSTSVAYTDFKHKYKGADVTFTNSDGQTWQFNTTTNLEDFSISLPTGTYTVSGQSSRAMPFPQTGASYVIPVQEIIVTNDTETVNITVTSTCTLILIENSAKQLYRNYIRNRSTGADADFIKDDTFNYGYIEANDNTFIYLSKVSGESFTMETSELEIGFVYYIVVTKTKVTGVTLTNDFQLWGTITW